jgi:drug/metabolite transporter (DMT)-like permease
MKRGPWPYLAIATASVSWGLSPVMIRFLSGTYDPFTQAFARYGSACVVLLAISLLWFRADLLQIARKPLGILGLALVNLCIQTAWTFGCYYSKSVTAQLIIKLDTIFVIVFAYLLYREERAVIRNPAFLGGVLFCFCGTAGIIFSRGSGVDFHQPIWASSLLVLFAFGWGIYSVWGKHLVGNIHPLPLFTVIATLTALGFACLAARYGNTGAILRAQRTDQIVLLLSGLLPVALAHCCFLYAQKPLGAAFCSTILLLNPLVTFAAANLLFDDEALSAAQFLAAALILAGAAAVVRARLTAPQPATFAAAAQAGAPVEPEP